MFHVIKLCNAYDGRPTSCHGIEQEWSSLGYAKMAVLEMSEEFKIGYQIVEVNDNHEVVANFYRVVDINSTCGYHWVEVR